MNNCVSTIIFEEEKFIIESKGNKIYSKAECKYSKIKRLYIKENKVIIMFEEPIEFILISHNSLIEGDFKNLYKFLTLKVKDDFIYKI